MKKSLVPVLLTFFANLSCLFASELTFEKPALEVTAPLKEQELNVDFPFINRTKETITIARFDSECSCMAIESLDKKLRIGPGENGTIRAIFQKGAYSGTVDKTVRIWLEGDPADKPSSVLKLRVHIPELVSISPRTVQWHVKGGNDSVVVAVKFPAETPAKIKTVSSSNPLFATELKTIEEGRSYEMKVSCSSTSAKALGVIRLEMESSLPGQQKSQIFAMVK